ncbi:MAG: hypothetical protein LBM76_03175 [Mycoplasmataceae bacterium]|jgi:4-amino-4-deoxy-L-arabinose transferase-like glycosyltransferase|nr:hypothetical protein [Mycoplasmataceae bacterium]
MTTKKFCEISLIVVSCFILLIALSLFIACPLTSWNYMYTFLFFMWSPYAAVLLNKFTYEKIFTIKTAEFTRKKGTIWMFVTANLLKYLIVLIPFIVAIIIRLVTGNEPFSIIFMLALCFIFPISSIITNIVVYKVGKEHNE